MRSSLLLVACLLLPVSASAQFTTLLTPPPKKAEPVAVATTPAAQTDTTVRRSLTEMKAWVDSAAAALEFETPAPDSARPSPDSAPSDLPARPRNPAGADPDDEETLAFRDGAPAPDTATDLPLLALIALSSLGVGVALLWRTRA